MNSARRSDFSQVLLQLLQCLSLITIHAKEISGEDILKDHRHDHGHENISPLDSVTKVHINIRTVKYRKIKAVDQLLVSNLMCCPADKSIRKLRKPQHPLLYVLTK